VTENKHTELIRAAGGLVWRVNKNQPEILVIHRSRYNDWALPKGKLKDGEHWDAAALREVAEETGYRAEIVSFADSLFYYVSEQPKLVIFWNMRIKKEIPESERVTDSPDEGDRVKWLTLDKALEKITYEDEKELIRGATPMPQNSASFSSSFAKDPLVEKMGWVKPSWLSDSGKRLRVSLEVYYREMKQLEFRFLHSSETINRESLELVTKQFEDLARFLEKSSEALKTNNLELGWEAFNAAQRQETQIYHEIGQSKSAMQNFARDRFEGRALSIFTEGNHKLRSWRKEKLYSLLEQKDQVKANPRLSEVLDAQQTLSDYFSNGYRRLGILRLQVTYLEIIAGAAILGWIALLLLFKPNLDIESGNLFSPFLTISSLLFGALGACISGILRLEKRSTGQKIPEQLEHLVYTVARPLVGAVSALAVVTFVLVGILDVGSQTPGLYLAAAFIAGFSERLLEFGAGKFDEDKSDKGE